MYYGLQGGANCFIIYSFSMGNAFKSFLIFFSKIFKTLTTLKIMFVKTISSHDYISLV